MELNQPNVKLVWKLGTDNSKAYSLFSVTVMEGTQYISLPFDQTTFSKNNAGYYIIELKVLRDESLPVSKKYLKHVTHSVSLNMLKLEGGDVIQVVVKEGDKKVGESGPLHVQHSDEDGK